MYRVGQKATNYQIIKKSYCKFANDIDVFIKLKCKARTASIGITCKYLMMTCFVTSVSCVWGAKTAICVIWRKWCQRYCFRHSNFVCCEFLCKSILLTDVRVRFTLFSSNNFSVFSVTVSLYAHFTTHRSFKHTIAIDDVTNWVKPSIFNTNW